ncbi:MAG: hypothetical protein AB1756_01180 [Acidobacteriota bacterium]
MEKPDLLKPALISGIIFGVTSAIPIISILNCFCCSLIFASGILAAFLLIRESAVPVTYGSGAMVGLLSGIFGAFSMTIVNTLVEITFGTYFKQLALSLIQDFLTQLPPDIMGRIEAELQREFTIFNMIFALFIALIMFGIFSTLGGILGVALFGKKKKAGEQTPSGQV